MWLVAPEICPMCLVTLYLCPLCLAAPAAAAAVAASLWNERKDGVRHVGHEVGVVVLEHASPVEGGRLPGPDAQH